MRQLVITTRITNRDTESLNQYLKEISLITPFTLEEEIECSKKSSLGDKKALDELVSRNLRFVITVAKQYANSNNHLPDLINEGNLGLIAAAERFKPEMGCKFISYGVYWIRKKIMEYTSNTSRMIRLPANKIDSLVKMEKEIVSMEQKLGYSISINDIVNELSNNQSPDKQEVDYGFLSELRDYRMDSLDSHIGFDDDTSTLGETIADNTFFKPADQELIDADTKKGLETVLNTLKPRDRKIIIDLFGLNGEIPRTLKDIGDEIGISREMVRQIRQKSLNKLRKQLHNSELKF